MKQILPTKPQRNLICQHAIVLTALPTIHDSSVHLIGCTWVRALRASNRYGEMPEGVAVLEDRNCSKCRGICNCSLCIIFEKNVFFKKTRGHRPTGILVHAAKATGYSSVSEMLHVQVSESLGVAKILKAELAKRGKENSFNGNSNSNLHSIASPSSPDERKLEKKNRKALKEMEDGNHDDGILLSEPSHVKPQISNERSQKTPDSKWSDRSFAKGELNDIKEDNRCDEILLKATETKNPPNSKKALTEIQDSTRHNGVLMKEVKISGDVCVPEKEKNLKVSGSMGVSSNLLGCKKGKEQRDSTGPYKVEADAAMLQNYYIEVDIPLPQGSQLATVAGVDLPPEDVGYALQFLEFCTTFKEILDLKEGEPAYVLRDLMHGRRGTRGKPSPVVHFHIQLLSLILKDLGEDSEAITAKSGKNSWLNALQKCASRSQCVLKKLKLDMFVQEADYDSLDSSQRLRLLVFLCDEVLSTAAIRSWINDQNLKVVQNVKETRERVRAAKKKEKQLKKQMLDEVAKATIAKNGAPLSISEHEAAVSQIKTEVAEAQAKIKESQELIRNGIKGCAAVRTEPILLDAKGRTYWRLNGYSDNSNILLQDVGTRDDVETGDKWYSFDVEQEKKIEEHISSLSIYGKRKLRPQKVIDGQPSKN